VINHTIIIIKVQSSDSPLYHIGRLIILPYLDCLTELEEGGSGTDWSNLVSLLCMTVGATSSRSLSSTYLNNLGTDSNVFFRCLLLCLSNVPLVFLTTYERGEAYNYSWFPLWPTFVLYSIINFGLSSGKVLDVVSKLCFCCEWRTWSFCLTVLLFGGFNCDGSMGRLDRKFLPINWAGDLDIPVIAVLQNSSNAKSTSVLLTYFFQNLLHCLNITLGQAIWLREVWAGCCDCEMPFLWKLQQCLATKWHIVCNHYKWNAMSGKNPFHHF